MANDPPRGPVTVDAAHHGRRLDQALFLLLPDLGLRARRRLCAVRAALVDGVPREPAFKVRQGQELSLGRETGTLAQAESPAGDPPRLLLVAGAFAALYKPSGLHTESLPGGGPSLAGRLPALLAGRFPPTAVLLTRLDAPTSGIVLASRDKDAAAVFRDLENRGLASKTYACLVGGRLERPLVLDAALDVARRAKTRVLNRVADDPLRTTRVAPLVFDPGRNLTLVRADIHKGARHQIRAHLAAAGLPILGDPLYGAGEAGGLRLHHGRLRFGDFQASVTPAWDEATNEDDPFSGPLRDLFRQEEE